MVMVEDGAHGCHQCTFFWGNFWALGDKRKSPVQLIQKGFAYDARIYQWLMFTKFQTQKMKRDMLSHILYN
jgi:hypothetical protein